LRETARLVDNGDQSPVSAAAVRLNATQLLNATLPEERPAAAATDLTHARITGLIGSTTAEGPAPTMANVTLTARESVRELQRAGQIIELPAMPIAEPEAIPGQIPLPCPMVEEFGGETLHNILGELNFYPGLDIAHQGRSAGFEAIMRAVKRAQRLGLDLAIDPAEYKDLNHTYYGCCQYFIRTAPNKMIDNVFVLVKWRVPFQKGHFPQGLTEAFYKPTWEPVEHINEKRELLIELFNGRDDETRRRITGWAKKHLRGLDLSNSWTVPLKATTAAAAKRAAKKTTKRPAKK
jgi:hypothetical protein